MSVDLTNLQKLYVSSNLPVLSSRERQAINLLFVEPDSSIRSTMRQTLTSIDIGFIADASEHKGALRKVEEHPYTHVIFDLKKTNLSSKEFLQNLLTINSQIVAIAASYEPTVDDVFDLLIAGARGFLVKPFTTETVDDAIVLSSKGERISDAILATKTRNEALAALVLSSLDKLSTVTKQSQHFETALREIPKRQMVLKRAMEVARAFARGGDEDLLEEIITQCVEKGELSLTRTSRYKRIIEERKLKELDQEKEWENPLR